MVSVLLLEEPRYNHCVSFTATREQMGPPPGSRERLRGLLSVGARFSRRPVIPTLALSTSAGMLSSGDFKQPTLP